VEVEGCGEVTELFWIPFEIVGVIVEYVSRRAGDLSHVGLRVSRRAVCLVVIGGAASGDGRGHIQSLHVRGHVAGGVKGPGNLRR